jgi:hypothetical protein
MFFVLSLNSPGVVEMWEAILTFVFMIILLLVSYGTDKLNTYLKEVSEDEREEQKNRQIVEGKKIQLR